MAVRPVDAEKYMELLKEQYLHHEAMGNKQVAKAWQGAMQLLYDMPTLTPSNEWVSRVQELDELYTKLQIVTGFTAEQLLEMFAAGYTLKKPDYSKHFEAMANLAESDPPNEPLTCEGCIHEHNEHENCNYCKRASYLGDYYYRHPPEGEA